MIRKGVVSSVNSSTREVRVYFPEDDFISGWLKVVNNSPFIADVTITPWLPNINDTVICVYESGFNSDGYVLGAL